MTPSTETTRFGGHVADALGVVTEAQTYRNLLYLLLAFPLGVLYYTVLTVGVAFGAALTVFLVGLALLVGTVLGTRLLARFERWLANTLLPVTIRPTGDVRTGDTTWTTLVAYLDAASTWRGLGFVVLKFWVGLVAVVTLSLLVSALGLVTAPLHYPHQVLQFSVETETVTWTLDTLPEALLAVPVGLVFTLVALHLTNAVASVAGRIATALLGEAGLDEEPLRTGT